MSDKNLYFIAILPNEPILSEIKTFKEDMKTHFNAGHALKSPAHITLQMPFRLDQDMENELVEMLEVFARTQNRFEVTLSGFDCFEPRVIFVKVSEHSRLIQLNESFKKYILTNKIIPEGKFPQRFHPHMTIATRDLSKEIFPKAWMSYKNKKYGRVFTANNLALLKHNGKHWDVYKELALKRS